MTYDSNSNVKRRLICSTLGIHNKKKIIGFCLVDQNNRFPLGTVLRMSMPKSSAIDTVVLRILHYSRLLEKSNEKTKKTLSLPLRDLCWNLRFLDPLGAGFASRPKCSFDPRQPAETALGGEALALQPTLGHLLHRLRRPLAVGPLLPDIRGCIAL